MTIEEFRNTPMSYIYDMADKSLRKLVSRNAETINRRINNIRHSKDVASPAVRFVDTTGGRFGTSKKERKTYTYTNKKTGKTTTRTRQVTRPMTRQELEYEAKREKDFLNQEGATVREARAYRKQLDTIALGKTREAYAQDIQRKYKNNKLSQDTMSEINKALESVPKNKITDYFKQWSRDAYNKKVGEMWDEFHRAREEMGTLYLKGSLDEAEAYNIVEKGLGRDPEDLSSYFKESITGIYEEHEAESIFFH